MQGSGSINYSLNKNDFYNILYRNTFFFLLFYYILKILLIIYFFFIRYQQYNFSDILEDYKKKKHLDLFFKSITQNMPFNILEYSKNSNDNNEKQYVGLSNNSYIFIIICYGITYFLILQGLIKNYLYSIYVNIIQVNNNNNPYNNPNCVSKISKNSYVSFFSNYNGIISMALIFLLPISIPYLIRFLNFDAYSIAKNVWFSYVILFLILSPLLITIIYRVTFYKKLDIFNDLIPYLEQKDIKIVEEIKNNFNFNFSIVYIFLFIIVFYCLYNFVYINYKLDLEKMGYTLLVIIFILFLFIPGFLICNGLTILFTNNYSENINRENIIENIRKNGVSSLYEILVKYNYPCFLK